MVSEDDRIRYLPTDLENKIKYLFQKKSLLIIQHYLLKLAKKIVSLILHFLLKFATKMVSEDDRVPLATDLVK